MKQCVIKRAIGVFITVMMVITCVCVGIPMSQTAYAADQQQMGNKDGYDYELWNQWGQGTATMDVGSNGAFSCSWNGIENCLFRTGKKLEKTKKYGEYNGMYIDYDVDYEPKGNSYMCVYGWTENPTVEYYIVEAWGSWRPPGSNNPLGTVEANGHTYDIYKTIRENQPSIHGTETFAQYWSVRQDNPAQNNVKKNIKGRISVSKHFDAWAKAGLDMSGTMYEVALNIEGYQSNGSANVKQNGLVMGEGDGDGGVVTPPKPIEPDENGHFFYSTFEDDEDGWGSRGDSSVKISSGNAAAGSKKLDVTGRTDSWNGTARALDTAAFEPGKSYGFSAMVRQDKTASEDFKLTLQCTIGGEDQYLNVASETGAKGEWVQLVNPSFEIPAGATNLLLYVETSDTMTDFSVDEMIGGIENSVKENVKKPLLGDVNGDKKVDVKDVILLQNYLVCKTKTIDFEAADMDANEKLNVFDLILLKRAVIKGAQQQVPDPTDPTEEPINIMENVKANLTADVPSNILNGTNGVTTQEITYYSSEAGRNKKAVVILPENYSTSKKYPVVYVNHGIFGSCNDMVGYCTSIGGNLMKSGEAEEMILVCTSMYTSKTSDDPPMGQFTVEVTNNYDAIREDLIGSLMPYMEKNYSIKTGRDNTAICGFSMGGRESLYVGITRPEYFGYIGAACPAPGVTPAKDSFMEHPGNMQPSEFKIQDHKYDPYLLMITGGTNDGVVGTFPKQYHETLTTNGQDHVWQEIEGGGHDANCVNPLMYNFLKNVFKAGKSSQQPDVTPNKGEVDISWIDPNKPMVAISFDDGAVGTAPTSSSMRIINALKDSGFHATFFYVSDWIRSNQAEITTAFDMGMEIANHTKSHPNLSEKTASEIRNEYDTCNDALKSIIGTEPSKLLRLPYLASNDTVKSVLSDVPMITCAIDTGDWNNATKEQIVNKIKTAMNDGTLKNAIVLAHETYDTTAAAMEELCPYLKSQGWQVVTISEMFAVNNKKLNGGQIYTKCQ